MSLWWCFFLVIQFFQGPGDDPQSWPTLWDFGITWLLLHPQKSSRKVTAVFRRVMVFQLIQAVTFWSPNVGGHVTSPLERVTWTHHPKVRSRCLNHQVGCYLFYLRPQGSVRHIETKHLRFQRLDLWLFQSLGGLKRREESSSRMQLLHLAWKSIWTMK